jgi:hypothetical protein
MSGDGKRSVAEWPKLPRPSSTLPVAAQFRMEALVPLSTCERIRTGQNDVIARINGIARNGTDEDLRAMSRIVDQFMIESAPQLQTMEESYATVNRIMREAGKK